MSKLQTARKANFHAYRNYQIAKLMAFILSRMDMCVYWVFKEKGCNLVINIDDADRFNRVAKKKMRVRDMNKMASFRTPHSTWGKIKINKPILN
jgi:hypothetical protein